ncbi:hypothetical protein V2W45_1332274 [Cenococcum geophilum]
MQRLVLLSPAPPLHVKRVDFAQTLLLPLPFAAAAPIAPPPWAALALTGSPPRGTNAAASPSSNPRTHAPALAPQHSNPHPHAPMEDHDPSSPRRRVGELPQTAAAPCPTHPIPKPQERVMWDGGLILDPAR